MAFITTPDILEKKVPTQKDKERKTVLVLAGPTAVGKTDLSIKLAKHLNGEIVSADSMQVYRGMDIGTAKISKEEMDGIAHHLIDIQDVKSRYNVVDFYHDAMACLHDICHRGKLPIVVGGTGFYLRALLKGPPPGPPSKPDLRERLEEQLDRIGTQAMYDSLFDIDPVYASTISTNDKQKIIRALEIISLTGGAVSSLPQEKDPDEDIYDFKCYFLTRPRAEIYQRIEQRCEKMLEKGFIEELERLDKMGIRENSSAKEAIGYRQGLEFLDSKRSLEDFMFFKQNFMTSSKKYVKRQFTWFKKETDFAWLDLSAEKEELIIEKIVKAVL